MTSQHERSPMTKHRPMVRCASALTQIVSATEACSHLGCTYQTLIYLVEQQILRPIGGGKPSLRAELGGATPEEATLSFQVKDLDECISFTRTLLEGRI